MSNESLLIPSKKSVRRAGEKLRSPGLSDEEVIESLNVLSQWRARYYRPINTIKLLVQKKLNALGIKSPIVAQRLKRTPSIISKLKRETGMQLDRMQDIGGVRAVVNNVQEVRRLHEALTTGRHHHKLVTPKDYIAQPKKDGYRGIHQVFKYHGVEQYNGMLVEVQIRTKLQHCWATAVETLGVIEKKSFKTGEVTGPQERFLQLSSALCSIYENEPVVPCLEGMTPQEIAKEFRDLEKELGVFNKLEGFTLVFDNKDRGMNGSGGYFLLILRRDKRALSAIAFSKKQEELATQTYALFEREEKDNPEVDIVLVASRDMKDLKKAYPNYFSDTKQFVQRLKDICNELLPEEAKG